MAAHARLSPSAADRWMICRGSVRLIERLRAARLIPEDETGEAAAEGTAAHIVRSDSLDLGVEPYHWVGQRIRVEGFVFDVTEDMAEHLQPGIDRLRDLPGRLVVEHRVDLGRWLPGQFGTLDAGVCGEEIIDIDDHKYGQGVPVEVVGSRQLRIYALGFWDNIARHVTQAKKFRLTIDQPRIGGIQSWEIELDELLAFGEEVEAAGRAILAGDDTLVPSDKGCFWCPVRKSEAGCSAYDRWMSSILGDMFDDLPDDPSIPPEPPEPMFMDPRRRWYIVQHADLARRWLAELHQGSMDAALDGKPDPGSKLVAGRRGDRQYADESRARTILVRALGHEAYTRKLLSIAQAEKIIKPGRTRKQGNPEAWEALNSLVVQPEGRPILASEDDPRPPVVIDWESQFEDLD